MPKCALFTRRSLLTALPFVPALRLAGQQPPAFSAGVNVVNVFATVRDKKGQIVRTLTKEDFLLEDDGQPQTIQYFSRESDLPLTVALLVDTSESQRDAIADERRAAFRFFEQVLKPERDQAAVAHFEREVELLVDLTSSRQKLEKALSLLAVPERPQLNRRDDGQPGGGRGPGRIAGTALYDAIYLACAEVLPKDAGRKALIALSDGVDNASRVPIDEAITAAQRTGAIIYAVRFQGETGGGFGWPGGGPNGRGGRAGGPLGGGRAGGQNGNVNGKKILERLATETGGRLFETTRKQTFAEIFSAIEEELRSLYSLGYPAPAGAAAFHRIRLAARSKEYTVQTRAGYYAGGW